MLHERPTLEDLKEVLEEIAGDSRIPTNFAEWVRGTLRYGGRKMRILRYIRARTPENQTPRLLDIGAQFGALAIYATRLGWRAADRGVEYRECDLGREPLPFADNSFDFAAYTDVIEHHPFSPKRVLAEIHRVLVPGGRLLLATPGHASLYNGIKRLFGAIVNDNFDYFSTRARRRKPMTAIIGNSRARKSGRRLSKRVSASSNAA
jgi:SAM-dependent methyltransferase